MTAAAIDLGTNTFHLIIARLDPSGLHILHKRNEPVKLGEKTLNENIISPEAIERGLLALESFRKDLDTHEVHLVKATATSAVRNAKNGANFVKAAKARADIEVEVITGDREAEYIFKGVQSSGILKGRSLIMDIGGGSTEFILCEENTMLWKQSFDIGAARLMQAYFHSDPIGKGEINAIISHLDQLLSPLFDVCHKHRPEHLVGSAGAFESFATLISHPDSGPVEMSSGPIDLVKYQRLSAQLIASTHQQRRQIPGLIPLRVDMIVIASVLTNFILEKLRIRHMSLSTYDLKMGVLYGLLVAERPV